MKLNYRPKNIPTSGWSTLASTAYHPSWHAFQQFEFKIGDEVFTEPGPEFDRAIQAMQIWAKLVDI